MLPDRLFPRWRIRDSLPVGPGLLPGRPRTVIAVTALRDSLTVLAILLIGVLTAALVGPYLIDWNAHRALIEHRLSEAAGAPVTVAGPIDLKILPTPRLDFGEVTIGDGRAGRPRLSVGDIEAEISFTALLRGQVQVVDTTLVRPRLEIAQARDGTFDLTLPSGRSADRVAIDHLGIRDGTLAVVLADGRRIALEDVAVDGEAASLRGPFKIAGRVGALPFRLATGTLDRGRLRVKLHVDGAASRPAVDLDGTAAAQAPAGSAPGASGPNFEGTATLAGALPLDGTPATVPWAMTGHLTIDRDAAAATDIELRAGNDMRALIAGGQGSATFAAGADLPAVALDLHGAAVDLDRLAVAPDAGSIAPPKGPDLLGRLVRAAGSGVGTALPARLDLKARFDTATLAGQTLLDPSARLGFGPEPDAALALGVAGPQGARLALDGRVAPAPSRPVSGPFGAAPAPADPVFRGHADLRSGDLRRTASWLAPVSPDLASALASLPGRNVAAGGDVEVSATGVVARRLSLTVDGSTFGGTLSLTRAVGGERGRLFADLTSDALALDRLPDPAGLSRAARDLDLDLALAARAVTVADTGLDSGAGRVQPIAAGNLALKLTRTGDDVRLDRLALDLDGAALSAAGSRSPSGATADLSVSAPHIGPLARAFGDLLPPPLAAALRARAGSLSPLDGTLRVEAVDAAGALEPTRLAVTATAGGTRIEADAAPEATAPGRPRSLAVTARAEAPDGADLLRQLGVPLTTTGLGAARLGGQGHGSFEDGMDLTLEGALGGTTLGFSGRGSAAGGAGRATLASADLRPLLASLGGAPAGGAVPADAAADMSWDAAGIGWSDLAAHVAGVTAGGDLSLDLQPPHRAPGGEPVPQVRGTLALDRLPASAVLALAFGPAPPSPAGAAWSPEPFGARAVPLPTAAVALRIGAMPLAGSLEARQVTLALATRADAVSLTGMAGRIGAGTFGGSLALRHDPGGDTLSGQVAWADLALGAGDFTGRLGGRQDVAATGASPAALVASLSGSGTLALADVALARTDPAAPGAAAAAIAARDAAAERATASTDATATDAEALQRDVGARLDRGPLPIGDAKVAATLAGGVLRIGPVRTAGTSAAPKSAGATAAPDPLAWSAETSVAVDLSTLSLSTRTALRGRAAGPGVDGGEVVVTRAGPLAGPARREVDVAGLLGAIQAQAIARAQERIDVIEQDIRERAAFNRQLKAIQADQQRARDRAAQDAQARADRLKAEAQARADQAKAEAQARRAEADRVKADELRVRAEVEAAARAAAERQREAPAPPPPASTAPGDGASQPPAPAPPADGP